MDLFFILGEVVFQAMLQLFPAADGNSLPEQRLVRRGQGIYLQGVHFHGGRTGLIPQGNETFVAAKYKCRKQGKIQAYSFYMQRLLPGVVFPRN